MQPLCVQFVSPGRKTPIILLLRDRFPTHGHLLYGSYWVCEATSIRVAGHLEDIGDARSYEQRYRWARMGTFDTKAYALGCGRIARGESRVQSLLGAPILQSLISLNSNCDSGRRSVFEVWRVNPMINREGARSRPYPIT